MKFKDYIKLINIQKRTYFEAYKKWRSTHHNKNRITGWMSYYAVNRGLLICPACDEFFGIHWQLFPCVF